MYETYRYSHIPFLRRELNSFLSKDSFAGRLWRSVGAELDYRLRGWPDEEESGFSREFPVEALFEWVAENGGFDPGWLAFDDGTFLDDQGNLLPSTIKPFLSGTDQLAAYGLWLIDIEMEVCGPSSEGDWDEHRTNPQGWNEIQVLEHKAECLLLAYQALSYIQRLQFDGQVRNEERTSAAQLDFSALGKAGATKRHAPMIALRTWATMQYRAGAWQSANHAAHELKNQVIEYGRTIGAFLTEQNAQRTIAEWFRKSV